MKLGIIGLSRSGKSTVFEALTHNILPESHKGKNRIGTIYVPDKRLDVLSSMYKPPKTIYAQIEYFLPDLLRQKKDQKIWTQVRNCDALIHVVRNFGGYGFEAPTPYQDFQAIDQELILTDLVVVEKKLEHMGLEKQRGKKADPEELLILNNVLKPFKRKDHLESFRTFHQHIFLKAMPCYPQNRCWFCLTTKMMMTIFLKLQT